jgi:hypothetical protein
MFIFLNGKYRYLRKLIASMWHKQVMKVIFTLVIALPLAACSSVALNPTPSSPSSTPLIPISGGSTPTDSLPTSTTTNQLPTASPTLPAPTATVTVGSNAPTSVTDAIKAVILKGNQEEIQAIATQNPNLMSDTSTSSYFQQTITEVNDLLNSGVTSLSLDNLQWGAITLQSSTTAQATDLETWTTNFTGGGTLQQTNTNVYDLVLQNGAWLVQDDQQPSSQNSKPAPSTSPAPGSATPAPSQGVIPLTPLGTGQSQSQNWSGYNATGGTYTAVSGTWVVPDVSSTAAGADATWVGIGGVAATDLIQAGTGAMVQGGQVVYEAWWETLPQAEQPVPMNVNAGDKVTVSITQQSAGSWKIVIQDVTEAETYTQTVNYQSSLSSAEWIEETPAAGRRTLLPLDNFNSVTFTNATTIVNGKQETIAQAGGQSITMVIGRVTLAQPSALTSNGDSFSVTRTSATAPTLSPGGRGGYQ